MASIPCITQRPITSKPNALPSQHVSVSNLASRFLGIRKRVGWLGLTSGIGPSNGSKATCWFKFGQNGVDAEGAGIYGSQGRDDFDRDDVEQNFPLAEEEFECMFERYFNYMGMLAVEGTYDKMEALLNQNIHPVDILLLLAASEGDKPKIEELLKAGAKYDCRGHDLFVTIISEFSYIGADAL
ncbi:Protein LHCP TRANSLOCATION DEFECT [Mucuna pruriens]|uniref:Protein LHCP TRANSLOCATION DEFECT n=1 Tax=Mucuna pruriens TaxID=157652 RepID=A0A371ED40_MUCPR|nr:Protein LHCP TRANSLOCATION DEFECT [Mucuna pruriens]